MQRNISRRDFGKRLAGGAVLLALQPAWNHPAAAQSLRNDLKDLSGELSFDEAVLQTAADDFGRVVHKKPIAVRALAMRRTSPSSCSSQTARDSRSRCAARRIRFLGRPRSRAAWSSTQ